MNNNNGIPTTDIGWKDQGNLVAYLLAAMPNGTVLTLGDRERSALTALIENLQVGCEC